MRQTGGFMRVLMIPILVCLAQPALASEEAQSFVEGNVLATLYHEIGHALIDVLDLPVLGREEDAADSLAMVMTHNMWVEEQARSVAMATALSFLISAEGGAEPAFWDVHGTDEQRFYTTVCLFYGADAENRADFAEDTGLPEGRAEGCAAEFTLADESWGSLLDDVTLEDGDPPAASFEFQGGEGPISDLLADEVSDLNDRFKLPVTVPVVLGECDEANAFYDPGKKEITICTEYVDFLEEQAAAADL